MTLVVPEDFASVIHSMRWSGDPELMAVTYGVAIDTGTPPTSATQLAEDLAIAFGDFILAEAENDISLVNTEVSWQETAPPDPPTIGSDGTVSTGAGTNDLLPQNSAFLFHKRSGVGGRGGRGRMYFPGVGAGLVDDLGNIDAGTITSINGSLSTLLTDIAAVTGVIGMVIFHDDGGAFAAEPPYLVTALQIDPVIATQRRRLRR